MMPDAARARLHVRIQGAVQGVGFRPFVYRLATEMGLAGWVLNSPQGVAIEAEGARENLEDFVLRLDSDKPPRASIHSLESTYLDAVGYEGFEVRASKEGGPRTAFVLPDIATCPDCLREIRDPADRRYRYPFTNCTNCGPRYSIIEALPYDRCHTTMRRFTMCKRCQAEYDNPLDRRFHAQPNACPVCGPQVELWDREGKVLARREKALIAAARAIAEGRIVAIKGLGGFHLVVHAHNSDALAELRRRKHREEKPFALMYPSIEAVRADCRVSRVEERLLLSPESPIVLLTRKPGNAAAAVHNPASKVENPYLGIMLPYTPLHHLLLNEIGAPIVATSGNLSDEPICTDERDALERLGAIADLFLVHDRPIRRHVDDSIARVMLGRELVLRRARGYAPLPVVLERPVAPTLATGAHLKNAVAIGAGDRIFVSQHIGDLETAESHAALRNTIVDLERLYELAPERIVHDAHPDYESTRLALELSAAAHIPAVAVQHHYAHVRACMAENRLEEPVLGVAWDGTGYGSDGTVWGGEFLLANKGTFERVAHLRAFPLPGGDVAAREPRRSALGLLYSMLGEEVFSRDDLEPIRAFSKSELSALRAILRGALNCPTTTSAGRLFDAMASLSGLRQITRHEGQAAMELEYALAGVQTDEAYPFALNAEVAPIHVDWQPLIEAAIADLREGASYGIISACFHNALAKAIVEVAKRIACPCVALSGGCFQNRYLTERTVAALRLAGLRPYWHQRIPPNDGGIALGQATAL